MALGVGGYSPGPSGLSERLGSVLGINLNVANTDTQFTLDAHVSGRYFVIDQVLFTNPSGSVTTATAGVFSAVAGSGTIFASGALSALTAQHTAYSARSEAASTLNGAITQSGTVFNTAPYCRVGTAQGAAMTCDVYLYGRLMDDQ